MSGIFGELLTFRQEQGGPVRLRTIGDEKYCRYETSDGFTVVYDTARGLYCYATLTGDHTGHFVSTGVDISEPAPGGVPRHLKEDNGIKNARIVDRFEAMVPPSPEGADTKRLLTFGPSGGLLPGRVLNTGNVQGLTILVGFPDTTTTVTQVDVDSVLNASTPALGNVSSVNQYFKTVSTGKLNFTNVVVGPFMMSQPKLFYADAVNEGKLVPEAIQLAEASGVDFTRFDSRRDGIVDSLCIMYAGRTEYRGDLWPHNWTHRRIVDGIRTDLYIVTAMGSRPEELSIGTFCHESGHLLLRWPDLYDYGVAEREGDDFDSAGVGFYCIMGAGNHLDRGKTPAPVSAYLRDLVSWCPKEVDLNTSGTYEAQHGAYDTVMRYRGLFDNEYYLVENRSRIGLDLDLPSSGLAVYHCDIRGSNEFQDGTAAKHYQCALLQADGHLDLEHNANQGDEGDLYGVTAGTVVSHSTKPASLWWNGSEAGLTLSDVSAPGEIITFTVGTPGIAGRTVDGESTPRRAIPDNNSGGLQDVIQLAGQGTVRALKIAVDITHPFIGDLKVELLSPSGKVAVLHKRTGFWKDNLHLALDSNPPSPLSPLVGQPAAGAWTLRVSDNAARDVGTLDHWRIQIETGT
jgi:M6 family metalloprotease-like protein